MKTYNNKFRGRYDKVPSPKGILKKSGHNKIPGYTNEHRVMMDKLDLKLLDITKCRMIIRFEAIRDYFSPVSGMRMIERVW